MGFVKLIEEIMGVLPWGPYITLTDKSATEVYGILFLEFFLGGVGVIFLLFCAGLAMSLVNEGRMVDKKTQTDFPTVEFELMNDPLYVEYEGDITPESESEWEVEEEP